MGTLSCLVYLLVHSVSRIQCLKVGHCHYELYVVIYNICKTKKIDTPRQLKSHFVSVKLTAIIFFQIGGISLGSLDDVPADAVTTFFRSLTKTLDFDFEDDNEGWFTFEPFT